MRCLFNSKDRLSETPLLDFLCMYKISSTGPRKEPFWSRNKLGLVNKRGSSFNNPQSWLTRKDQKTVKANKIWVATVLIAAAWFTAEALTGPNELAACLSLGFAQIHCCILQSHFGANKYIYQFCIFFNFFKGRVRMQSSTMSFPPLGKSQGPAHPWCNGESSRWENHLHDHGISLPWQENIINIIFKICLVIHHVARSRSFAIAFNLV